MKLGKALILWTLWLLPAATPVAAEPVTIDAERSLFALLTQRAGVAARLAHDHLVAATAFEAELDFSTQDPSATSFRFETAVDQLSVDDPTLQAQWSPRLDELALLDRPYEALDDRARGKIRAAMLGPKQLDAEQHPVVAARLVSIAEDPSRRDEVDFGHRAVIEMTVRGTTVELTCAARCAFEDDRVVLEALCDSTFSAFGIEPYSAAFGAVRNADEIHVFVHMEGVAAPTQTVENRESPGS